MECIGNGGLKDWKGTLICDFDWYPLLQKVVVRLLKVVGTAERRSKNVWVRMLWHTGTGKCQKFGHCMQRSQLKSVRIILDIACHSVHQCRPGSVSCSVAYWTSSSQNIQFTESDRLICKNFRWISHSTIRSPRIRQYVVKMLDRPQIRRSEITYMARESSRKTLLSSASPTRRNSLWSKCV